MKRLVFVLMISAAVTFGITRSSQANSGDDQCHAGISNICVEFAKCLAAVDVMASAGDTADVGEAKAVCEQKFSKKATRILTKHRGESCTSAFMSDGDQGQASYTLDEGDLLPLCRNAKPDHFVSVLYISSDTRGTKYLGNDPALSATSDSDIQYHVGRLESLYSDESKKIDLVRVFYTLDEALAFETPEIVFVSVLGDSSMGYDSADSPRIEALVREGTILGANGGIDSGATGVKENLTADSQPDEVTYWFVGYRNGEFHKKTITGENFAAQEAPKILAEWVQQERQSSRMPKSPTGWTTLYHQQHHKPVSGGTADLLLTITEKSGGVVGGVAKTVWRVQAQVTSENRAYGGCGDHSTYCGFYTTYLQSTIELLNPPAGTGIHAPTLDKRLPHDSICEHENSQTIGAGVNSSWWGVSGGYTQTYECSNAHVIDNSSPSTLKAGMRVNLNPPELHGWPFDVHPPPSIAHSTFSQTAEAVFQFDSTAVPQVQIDAVVGTNKMRNIHYVFPFGIGMSPDANSVGFHYTYDKTHGLYTLH